MVLPQSDTMKRTKGAASNDRCSSRANNALNCFMAGNLHQRLLRVNIVGDDAHSHDFGSSQTSLDFFNKDSSCNDRSTTSLSLDSGYSHQSFSSFNSQMSSRVDTTISSDDIVDSHYRSILGPETKSVSIVSDNACTHDFGEFDSSVRAADDGSDSSSSDDEGEDDYENLVDATRMIVVNLDRDEDDEQTEPLSLPMLSVSENSSSKATTQCSQEQPVHRVVAMENDSASRTQE